jgi:hypothetical protein
LVALASFPARIFRSVSYASLEFSLKPRQQYEAGISCSRLNASDPLHKAAPTLVDGCIDSRLEDNLTTYSGVRHQQPRLISGKRVVRDLDLKLSYPLKSSVLVIIQ